MKEIFGLGKLGRKRLVTVIRQTKGTISVKEASEILKTDPSRASKMLAFWAAKGWVSRVRRGLYVPVPIESLSSDIPLEDPWLVADRLFSPCYIGGWSAAEQWGLTEQIYRTVLVCMTRRPRRRDQVIKGISFKLKTVPQSALFGLTGVWRGKTKVNVSDPTRTILDLLSDPRLGGGLRPSIDVFRAYLASDQKNAALLLKYADRLGVGAVFKRLGYLTQRYAPEEASLIQACRARLTKGNARLDPGLPQDRLITFWRLWIPSGWLKEKSGD